MKFAYENLESDDALPAPTGDEKRREEIRGVRRFRADPSLSEEHDQHVVHCLGALMDGYS
jgi:hypothetical protein